MKISTKGKYALRLMIDLAIYGKETPVSVKDIARRQEISDKYLEQIIAVLNKAGYVRSVRGAQGGYQLTKPAREYTAGMILRLTEGSLSPVACLVEEEIHCDRKEYCAPVYLYKKIDDAIRKVVEQVTLQDLVEWQISPPEE